MNGVDGLEELAVNLRIPDLWQQEAVRALVAGKDVVVHAPTGAGKTLIFELFIERGWRRQAVFTVPTRALANDKLIEWRRKGWHVGIATGDVSENLDAPVIVATLETQKSRFLRREGPALLVVDEYQLLADRTRGLNYELAIALAPPSTQLLLLSGSVANPQAIADWMRRLGRDVIVVDHQQRPVPLEEVWLEALRDRIPASVKGFWPRLVARALAANLGPILMFAPQRSAAEKLARHLAAALPVHDPLRLSPEQERIAGDRLARMLKARVAFHHSGLSYAQRAGLIEPLAKAGQLRVVVATTGLAAGINFSMRSVLVTDVEYTADHLQRRLRSDELLQMFGRAGRRGLDEIGFVLVAPERPRLLEARPLQVRRADPVEWPGVLAVMNAAVVAGEDPFRAAVALCGRLFSPSAVPVGVEHALETGPMACGIMIDAQRARHAQPRLVEMLNSRGLWEARTEPESVPLGEAQVYVQGRWRRAVAVAAVMKEFGRGQLCLLARGRARCYGRELPIAGRSIKVPGKLVLTRPLRRYLVARARELGCRPPPKFLEEAFFRDVVLPAVPGFAGGGRVHAVVERQGQLYARIDFSSEMVNACRDAFGVPLVDPPERRAYPAECSACPQLEVCERQLPRTRSPALAWWQLGLIDKAGRPTRRGTVFSFFHNGEGLAVAAALEDETYPIDQLLHDLANLRAGHRFEERAGASARLGATCRRVYGDGDYDGYLRLGLPPQYGDGAAEVLADVAAGRSLAYIVSPQLRPGDIERARLEWLSLVRHIAQAPDLGWTRWQALRAAAQAMIDADVSRPQLGAFPPLTAAQSRRVDHRLRF